MITLFDRRRTS